jgi:hypothetical protein
VRDQDVLQAVSDGLSGLDMDTPAEEIIAGGTARRRRRTATVTVAGLAVAAGIAVGLPALSGSGPAGPPAAAPPASATLPASAAPPPNLAAFSVVSNSNGTVTLSLSRTQLADPDEVRDALSKAGVRANVRVGSPCYSVPAPPGIDRVFSGGQDPGTVLAITPSAIPKGAVVTIGYRDPSSDGPIGFGLAWADRMVC